MPLVWKLPFLSLSLLILLFVLGESNATKPNPVTNIHYREHEREQHSDYPLLTGDVDYNDENGKVFQGYVAYLDDHVFFKPGVLIHPDWDSVGEDEEVRADQFARLGFVAFALDIYGKGIRPNTTNEKAGNASIIDNDRYLARSRGLLGLDVLASFPNVDIGKITNIGYCLGGMTALEMVRSGRAPYIRATVSFHGSPDTPYPEDDQNIQGPVLMNHGGQDPGISVQDLLDFQEQMFRLKKDFYFMVFSDAVHAFTNRLAGNDPSKGAAYNEKADIRSFAATLALFEQVGVYQP